MFNYQLAITINKSIEQQWFTWLSVTHIPEVINTAKTFWDYHVLKLLSPEKNQDTVTYEIHYVTMTKGELEEYNTNFAQKFLDKHREHYGENIREITVAQYEDLTHLTLGEDSPMEDSDKSIIYFI